MGEDGRAHLAKNATEEGVKVTPSGLQYRVLETGNGERVPTPDQTCEVSYVSRLVNGVVVRGVQFIEVTPVEEVDGMEEALMSMREGDRWELSIPAEMAFGKQGMGHIPPNAVLIVDLQLHEVLRGKGSFILR